MAKKEKPEIVEITETEAESLLSRLQTCNLDDKDKKIVTGLIRANFWLRRQYESGKIGFHKLATLLFGKKTEKTGCPKEGTPSNPEGKERGKSEKTPSSNPEESHDPEDDPSCCDLPKKKPKGHGRLAASAYQSDEDIFVCHPFLRAGDFCPEACGGRLYERDPGVVIRIKGKNFAHIISYHLQKLRCSTCGTYVHIPLPEGARGPKYDARFKAILAVQKYFVAVPFYRQEAFLKLVGFPLSDATQWMLMEDLALSVYPIIEALEEVAARGDLICNDDTSVKILELMKAYKKDPNRKRKGMFTTGIYARSEGRLILLYYSSERHAGENLAAILAKRPKDLPPIIHMCDALSHNLTPDFKVLLSRCLTHARRQFKDIDVFFPLECYEVIQAFGLVYKHEAQAKKDTLSPQQRLVYHQTHSGPIMDKLKAYVMATQPSAEPNGDLYKAMAYVLKHWQALTLFLRVPGALLDNNLLEAALKLPVRIRKNSLFYKTLKGAEVGGIVMSLVDTCRANTVNPVEYLVALQDHASAVAKDPDQWLPWTYEKTLATCSPPRPPHHLNSHPTPPLPHYPHPSRKVAQAA